MKRIFHIALCVALMGSCDAHAVGGIAEVTIFDRDTGAALKPYFYRGEYWVAGTPGTRYAIQIRNRLGQRLLAVTAVDGLNVLSGALAGWDQVGYVFNPGERYQISGWRKSDAEVAAFTFTDARNSYADRTGRPANVGVIGVALFRERQPQQVPYESAPSSGAPPLPAPPPLPATRRHEPRPRLWPRSPRLHPSSARATAIASIPTSRTPCSCGCSRNRMR